MGIFRELRYELSALFFALGILGMVFSLTQYLAPTQSPDWLKSIHHAVGEYVVWEAFHARAFGDPAWDAELYPVRAVARRHHVRMLVQPVHLSGRLRAGYQDQVEFEWIHEGLVDRLPQLSDAASGPHGNREWGSVEFRIFQDACACRDSFFGKNVDLRQHRDDGVRRNVREERAGRKPDLSLDLRLGIRGVDQEEDQVRLKDLLERGVERLDQPERHAIDESDCVREQDPFPRPDQAARGRRQGRKHPVLHEQMLVRQGVTERRLPCVRIAREGDQVIAPVLPYDPSDLPLPSDRLEFVADLLHPTLHGFVVRVDPLLPARHETGPLPDVSLMDPFPEERDLIVEEG